MAKECKFVIGRWCVDGWLVVVTVYLQFKSKSLQVTRSQTETDHTSGHRSHLMDKPEVIYRATEGGADQDDLGLGGLVRCAHCQWRVMSMESALVFTEIQNLPCIN